jgi:hypothetical protein
MMPDAMRALMEDTVHFEGHVASIGKPLSERRRVRAARRSHTDLLRRQASPFTRQRQDHRAPFVAAADELKEKVAPARSIGR